MRLQDFLAQRFIDEVAGGAVVDFSPALGQNVFVGYMPSPVTEGLVFSATLPLNENHYTRLLTGGAQVIYRSEMPDKAAKIMRQVIDILNGFDTGDVSTDGIRILKILNRHEPLTYRRQDNGTFESSVNFDVICTFQ